jgi:hypothetical protein
LQAQVYNDLLKRFFREYLDSFLGDQIMLFQLQRLHSVTLYGKMIIDSESVMIWKGRIGLRKDIITALSRETEENNTNPEYKPA